MGSAGTAIVETLGAIPLAEGDAEAGILRQDLAKLGGRRYDSKPLRPVQVKGASGEILLLVTNLRAEAMSAADLALLCKQRWGIEYFFRWVKCVMGCGHRTADSEDVARELGKMLAAEARAEEKRKAREKFFRRL